MSWQWQIKTKQSKQQQQQHNTNKQTTTTKSNPSVRIDSSDSIRMSRSYGMIHEFTNRPFHWTHPRAPTSCFYQSASTWDCLVNAAVSPDSSDSATRKWKYRHCALGVAEREASVSLVSVCTWRFTRKQEISPERFSRYSDTDDRPVEGPVVTELRALSSLWCLLSSSDSLFRLH